MNTTTNDENDMMLKLANARKEYLRDRYDTRPMPWSHLSRCERSALVYGEVRQLAFSPVLLP